MSRGAWSLQRPPRSRTSASLAWFHTCSDSSSTPSRSNTTARSIAVLALVSRSRAAHRRASSARAGGSRGSRRRSASRALCRSPGPRSAAARSGTGPCSTSSAACRAWRAAAWRVWRSLRKRLSWAVWICSWARSARASAAATSRASPRPLFADTASTGGRWRSFCVTRALASSRSVRVTSHLLRAITVAQLFCIAMSATRRSSLVTPSSASQTTIATSARSAACSERSWA